MKTKSEKTEPKTDEIIETLKSCDFIHSILLFSSRARGKTGRELPVHIRKRISGEGKLLYTKDMYLLLTLFKENDLEYAGYKKYREYYNKATRERLKRKIGKSSTLHT